MSIEEQIRTAVRDELRSGLDEIRRLLLGEGAASDLTTVTKAAKACGIHPDTARAKYLSRVKKYGKGRALRISVADLRAAMAADASGDAESEASAEQIAASITRRRGRKDS